MKLSGSTKDKLQENQIQEVIDSYDSKRTEVLCKKSAIYEDPMVCLGLYGKFKSELEPCLAKRLFQSTNNRLKSKYHISSLKKQYTFILPPQTSKQFNLTKYKIQTFIKNLTTFHQIKMHIMKNLRIVKKTSPRIKNILTKDASTVDSFSPILLMTKSDALSKCSPEQFMEEVPIICKCQRQFQAHKT